MPGVAATHGQHSPHGQESHARPLPASTNLYLSDMANPMVVSNLKQTLLLTSSTCLTLIGAVLLLCWRSVFDMILHNELKMTPTSRTFEIWRDTPVPIYMNFYFFNWTNPEELGVEKPRLQQLGPYRFYETEEKREVHWNDNDTITFEIARKWYFDPENSVGSLDDEVITLNAVAMSAAHSVRHWSFMLRRSVSIAMSTTKQEVHIKKRVGDLLFDGYTDPLLDFALNLPSFAGVNVPYDKFGWFYMRNGSSDFEGVFNMDTGTDDILKIGKLHNWNHNSSTFFYDGQCGLVNGSAGELFPPHQTKDNYIEMFSADLCRSIRLTYSSVEDIAGIQGYRYIGGREVFDNGTLDPSNECFCNGECVPSGVVNVTACRYGAPGFVSYPHFYLADPFYHNQVEGMSPLEDDHQMYIVLEPNTGIPLDVAARFQINILLSKQKSIKIYENVPQIFFPMIWFEQRATITEELALQLRILLSLPLMGHIIASCLFFTGLIMFGLFVFLKWRIQRSPVDGAEVDKLKEGTNQPLMERSLHVSPVKTTVVLRPLRVTPA